MSSTNASDQLTDQHHETLQEIYDHFRQEGVWPTAFQMQLKYRSAARSFRVIVREIGTDLVICEDGKTGVCWLRIDGLALCEGSEKDVEEYLAAHRYMARRYVEAQGDATVRGDDLKTALGIDDDLALSRLVQLLFRDMDLWSSATPADQPAAYTFTLREDAMYFENVRTLDELRELHARIRQEGFEASRLAFSRSRSSRLARELVSPIKIPVTVTHSDFAGLLHPALEEEALPTLRAGSFRAAVLDAFRCVEVAVRMKSGLAADLVGVQLMRKAFHPNEGPLANPELPGGEQQAQSDLFAGAIGHFKNPASHRAVEFESNEAARGLVVASCLLYLLDSIGGDDAGE